MDSSGMMLYFACFDVMQTHRINLQFPSPLCLKRMKLGHDGIDRPNGVCLFSSEETRGGNMWEDTRYDDRGCWRVYDNRIKGSSIM